MANIKILFEDCSENEHFSPTLECFLNDKNQITLIIVDLITGEWQSISLDKSTAIKLAKVLRSEINKIQEP